jgi:zinc finger SWIM domain-containing protein 3
MPLVLFVGVNHHGQSVIFASCLLAKEGEAEYIWCFQRFLDCMGGVKPTGILTDQCASIECGVREVLGVDTVHRYCSWHILHKLCSKWGNVPNKDALSDKVKAVVYGSLTEAEFEYRWLKLMRDLGTKQHFNWFYRK